MKIEYFRNYAYGFFSFFLLIFFYPYNSCAATVSKALEPECEIMAFPDHLNYSLSNEITVSFILSNDILPDNYTFEVLQNVGSIWSAPGVTITITSNSILIENLPPGIFQMRYIIACDESGPAGSGIGFITIVNRALLEDCEDCAEDELFCYGDIEDFGAGFNHATYYELGFANCYENGFVSSPDIHVQSNGNQVLGLAGTPITHENIFVPLTPPLQPECNINICFDGAALLNPAGTTLPIIDLVGTNNPPCSFQGEVICSDNPSNCIGIINIENSIEGYPSGGVPYPLDFQQYCIEATNMSNEIWTYLKISMPYQTGGGYALIDNLNITSDCCENTLECIVYEYDDETGDNCEGVVITYCNDGSVTVESISADVNYVKIFVDDWSNGIYLCADPKYGKPAPDCDDDLFYQLDPGSQVIRFEISYYDDSKCWIDPPAEFVRAVNDITNDKKTESVFNSIERSSVLKGDEGLLSKIPLEFFPNPAYELLTIRNPNESKYKIELLSLNGVLALQPIFLNEQATKFISLEKMITGIYILKFTNLQNQEFYIEKLSVIN